MGTSIESLEICIKNTFDKVKKFQEGNLDDCLSDELIRYSSIQSYIFEPSTQLFDINIVFLS